MVRALRRQIIDDLMAPVTSTVTALTARKLPGENGLQCKKESGATGTCNLVTLASLTQSLHSLNLWPLPDSKTWAESASELADTLAKLSIMRKTNHQDNYDLQKRCPDSVITGGCLSWRSQISVVSTTNEQLKLLKLQAAKMGLPENS